MEITTNAQNSFAKLRQRLLVGEVRDELERMILEGELPAGERLDEVRLAGQIGVSRGPVREAARSLEHTGLVRTVPNQGVYVRKFSFEEALELYDLRAMMAGYLCASVAHARDPVVIASLNARVEDMQLAAAQGDESTYFDLNLKFHDEIAAASGTTRASGLYGSLGKEVRLMRLKVLTGPQALAISNAEHREIVDALGRGDTEEARARGAQHHMNGKKRLLESR